MDEHAYGGGDVPASFRTMEPGGEGASRHVLAQQAAVIGRPQAGACIPGPGIKGKHPCSVELTEDCLSGRRGLTCQAPFPQVNIARLRMSEDWTEQWQLDLEAESTMQSVEKGQAG